MATTTYWTWIVECDEPSTGRRIGLEGEVIAPLDATEEELRQRLFPELSAQLQRRYGPGYSVEGLSPACRFDRKK
ncbi:hypothetical protein D8771_26560 [Streptomyces albus]|uniref:Uncharacterized protein n=1 Tax=Streptomyces albus TaxID=1888 RepID=A0A8H1QQ84_9ACTN|nr:MULTISPECIES: hypothetical protein [Streptomyces]TGG77863.1 hypothetical protein D8771_26560 [Streptomyces albus]TXJ73566.1 hypothetical protein E2C11_29070 [Streptomyces lavendulae]